ncbi:BrnT family toxin [Nitrospira tepida]|uniref:BrnT family toxin n=1 Tax=Nitrospira tepida TaxID=2973512 RepID=A0AA86TBD3_9BACT|nr:BrnT family toxin [Nitrospira tepida]
MEFEWDLSKELRNIRKHGVTFSEAVESFLDKKGFQLVDAKHSVKEKRLFWVGQTSTGRLITTRFTMRGSRIRLIGSAEWRKFRRLYDERTKARTPEGG